MSNQPQPFRVDVSARISRLPPYLFGRINKLKYEKRVAGIDIIDLGMGNPTDPTPPAIVEKLAEAARDPRNHRYSVSNGIAGLRKEVAKKYERNYGVDLDPETEVIATIGSKEGFSHLCLALLGPGDTVVVGDPAFPIHIYAPAMAGAKELGVEFTTMSKSYNMAGWRCGFCCGNAEMVRALGTIKGYYDYGMFAPIQIASVIAMREHGDFPPEQSKIYQHRRDVVCRG